ncbi:Complex I intermediate-associated protein 84, mitochondrial [Cytospora mali]|uniref:Complex I intermediate-associated protein 84, mitochondrial n=1 Tax=Cytospora mali TaxID=578113 RepID=A0A194UV35_CYTMA|nr:Complex I intermediate-associated protein 84, mitochondrial [Valsa mali var. pyri (nom. inval.)]
MNLFKSPPREVRDAGFEPGFGTFVEFHARSVEGTKLPPNDELLQEFRRFFDFKVLRKKPLNNTQAFCARLLLKHLQNTEDGFRLELKDLQKASYAISLRSGRGETSEHVQFATELYNHINLLKYSGPPVSDEDRLAELRSDDFERYMIILVRYGASMSAAEHLSNFKDLYKHFDPRRPNELNLLRMLVLKGFEKEGNETGLRRFAGELIEAGFDYSAEFHEVMTCFYAGVGEGAEKELRTWFEKPIKGGTKPRPDAYMALIKFSSRTGREPEWLKKAMQKLCDSNPPKSWWDIILRWAIYQGKDIEQLKRMIDVMVQSNPGDESIRPDAHTVNGLIAAATEYGNALLAERINGLSSDLGLRPNSTTYALLLEARIAGKDSTGAASSFDDLIHCAPLIGKPIVVINKYIRYLCSDAVLDYRQILDVLSHVERQGLEVEPETVVDLCLAFFKNDNAHEVIDTLSLHIGQFSMDDRHVVQQSLINYCLDSANSTARAWNGYSVLRQFFPETSREERIRLMEGFFKRKRADMACYIFGHMRAHVNDDMRPNLNNYIACLEGLGACPDLESLQMVHNMFKMDTKIQPVTKLYNAFMIAYTACGKPSRAFDFWQEISTSIEGPTYSSLSIVFRVCQVLPYGDEKAKVIWDRMQRMEIEIPLHVYESYVVMNAGQAHLDEVKSLLTAMPTQYGKEPDWYTLVEIFNALPNPELQEEYKEWIASELPEAGQPLLKAHKTKTLEGTDRIPLKVGERRRLRA